VATSGKRILSKHLTLLLTRKHAFLLFLQIQWPTQRTIGHPDYSPDNMQIFLLTFHGVHCCIQEPTHPTKCKDCLFLTNSSNNQDLITNLGYLLRFSTLGVWMKGPVKASDHDILTFFQLAGLEAILPASHRIFDCEYIGEPIVIGTPNSHIPTTLRHFKSRAGARIMKCQMP
jgi:hypothetical protein